MKVFAAISFQVLLLDELSICLGLREKNSVNILRTECKHFLPGLHLTTDINTCPITVLHTVLVGLWACGSDMKNKACAALPG